MPIPRPDLNVLPNPWTYIDHRGRPAGVVPVEPPREATYAPPTTLRAVGAKVGKVRQVRAARHQRVGTAVGEIVKARHDLEWEFSDEPTTVPFSAYYRAKVRKGELLAADEPTARACGVKFVEPKAALEKARKEAIERFDAETGEDAFAHFEKLRADEAAAEKKREEAAKAAAEPKTGNKPAEKPAAKTKGDA